MRRLFLVGALIASLFCLPCAGMAADDSEMAEVSAKDFKTFTVPENVNLYRVSFDNQYGMRLVGHLFMPKELKDKAAAVIVGHPMGASKERPLVGGAPFSIKEDSPAQRKASYDFYRGRGEFLPKGEKPEDTTRSDQATNVHFMNFYPFNDIETISPRPMLFIMGEKAHSRPFTIDAYAKAAEPKELMVIPGAGHFDLYDKLEFIPADELAEFFQTNLKREKK